MLEKRKGEKIECLKADSANPADVAGNDNKASRSHGSYLINRFLNVLRQQKKDWSRK